VNEHHGVLLGVGVCAATIVASASIVTLAKNPFKISPPVSDA
jgi:hypothetical protein